MPPDVSPRTPVRFRSRPLSLTPTILDPDGRAPARQAPSLLLGGGGGGGEDSEEELEVIDIDEVASGWGESCEEEEAGQQAEALLPVPLPRPAATPRPAMTSFAQIVRGAAEAASPAG